MEIYFIRQLPAIGTWNQSDEQTSLQQTGRSAQPRALPAPLNHSARGHSCFSYSLSKTMMAQNQELWQPIWGAKEIERRAVMFKAGF